MLEGHIGLSGDKDLGLYLVFSHHRINIISRYFSQVISPGRESNREVLPLLLTSYIPRRLSL